MGNPIYRQKFQKIHETKQIKLMENNVGGTFFIIVYYEIML